MVEKNIGDLVIRYSDLLTTMSETDLMFPVATLEFVTGLSGALNGGLIFEVEYKDYHMRVEFKDRKLYITRNEYSASLELDLFSEEKIHVGVSWSETTIGCGIYNLSEGWGRQHARAEKTCFTVIPPSLIKLFLTDAALDGDQFRDAKSFLRTVINTLAFIEKDIHRHAAARLFWSAGKPLREPEITRGVGSMLTAYGNLLGFGVLTEPRAGAGDTDFYLSSRITPGITSEIAIEAKNAHSNDVAKGITKQLPKYIENLGADFGIYLVYWLKCRFLNEPAQSSFGEFQIEKINTLKYPGTIRVVGLDLSYPVYPSRL